MYTPEQTRVSLSYCHGYVLVHVHTRTNTCIFELLTWLCISTCTHQNKHVYLWAIAMAMY